eukprot:3548732-Pyramimonas_sp.AAC.2
MKGCNVDVKGCDVDVKAGCLSRGDDGGRLWCVSRRVEVVSQSGASGARERAAGRAAFSNCDGARGGDTRAAAGSALGGAGDFLQGSGEAQGWLPGGPGELWQGEEFAAAQQRGVCEQEGRARAGIKGHRGGVHLPRQRMPEEGAPGAGRGVKNK